MTCPPDSPSLTKSLPSLERLSRLGAVLGLVLALTCIFSQNVLAQNRVIAKASNENGYGRVVFTFDSLPRYSKEVAGTILVISFKEPVKADLSSLAKDIPNIVSVARADPDGRAVRFALTGRFRVNLIEAGNKLFVDILSPNWVGLPPSLPREVVAELARISQEAAARQREEERQAKLARQGYFLNVRAGRYKTFSRLVFDWNKFVVASMSREGSLLRVKFSVRANTDLSRIKADPPPFLKAIKRSDVNTGMEFALTLDPDANVRGFRDGLAYVVDLTSSEDELDRAAEQTVDEVTKDAAQTPPPGRSEGVSISAEPSNEAKKTEAQSRANPLPVDPAPKPKRDWETDVSATPQNGISTTAQNGQNAKVRDETDVAAANPVEVPTKKEDVAAVDTPLKKAKEIKEDTPPADYAPEDGDNEQALAEIIEQEKPDKPKKVQPQELEEISPETTLASPQQSTAPKVQRANKVAKTPVNGPPKKEDNNPPTMPKLASVEQTHSLGKNLRATQTNNELSLTFSFQAKTPAAVFSRDKNVWLVFDTDEKIGVSELPEKFDKILHSAEVLRGDDAKILLLKLKNPGLANAVSNGNAWTIDIGTLGKHSAKPLTLRRSSSPGQKKYVSVNLQKPGPVHWIRDPERGDHLAIVTAHGPARSVTKPHNFVDFRALATAHGIVVKPIADGLTVRPRTSDVVISTTRGLTLSSATRKQRKSVRASPILRKDKRKGFIDFKNWSRGGPAKFNDRLSDLEHAIANAKNVKRNELRLQLARFFMGHRLAPEALGTIGQITATDPHANNNPAVTILRGAANTLMGRHATAKKDLLSHELLHDADASLWRGLVNTQTEKWDDALEQFSAGADAISDYPEDLQARFRLGAAAAAIENKLYSRAEFELGALPQTSLPSSLVAESDLVRGRYLEEIGKNDEAMEAYTAVLEAGVAALEAQARLRTINLLYQQKQLELEKAIQELEALSIAWRGDNTELRTLRMLTDFYAKQGQYRQAFQTMKNAVKAFPDADIALRIHDDMKDTFRDIFLHGKGKQLPVTSAIGLFYDYKELTPPGRLGDEMIRRLADKLISVDLLDQAAELLEHQVGKRLTGAARAQVATRLAMVHLMNAKPELALRALRKSRQPDIPAHTKRARDILEARALGELGRASSAIDLLSPLEGDDIERLRGDVLWNAQKWGPAGEQFERRLANRWEDADELTKEERFDVVRAAISYSLAKDRFALNRLRKKFYEKMAQSEDADAFVLVTQPVQSDSKQFDKLVKDIASSSTLDAFMKDFRKDFENPGSQEEVEPASETERRPFG